MNTKVIRAFFDRVEGRQGVLLLGESERESIVIPIEYLPDNARPGSVLSISICEDEDETASLKDETQRMIDDLGGQ